MSGRRNPPAKWTLPNVINPIETVCFQIQVPKNAYHIAAFRGAMLNLASAVNWQDDPSHKAREVALVWLRIYDNIRSCAADDSSIELCEDDMQLRVDPDDNCIIQMKCGEDWVTFYDPRQCIASGASNPAPEGELADGECRAGTVHLDGNSMFIMPFPVQAGYTIQISNAKGGWWDGNVLHAWNCPSGLTYALGACVSAGVTDAGSPIPALSVGRIIAKINGLYYDAYNQTITVPAGTPPSDLYFQMNDASLDDNKGSISFDITVCNKAVAEWEKIFSFPDGTQDWELVPDSDSGDFGVYDGNFFSVDCAQHYGAPTWWNMLDILRSFDPAQLTYIRVDYDAVIGSFVGSITQELRINTILSGTPTTQIDDTSIVTGTSFVEVTFSEQADAVDVLMVVAASNTDCSTAGGTGHIRKITIRGEGTNPFI